MNEKFWEKPVCFLCDYWWIFLIAIVLAFTAYILRDYWLPSNFSQSLSNGNLNDNFVSQPVSTLDETPFSDRELQPQSSPSNLAPPDLQAIIGEPLPVVTVNMSWNTYQNDDIGLTVSYPPEWFYVEDSGRQTVNFYQPNADSTLPENIISISFVPQRIYDPQDPLTITGSELLPITVVGIDGIQYQDIEFSIPTQSYYIELPYREGTLWIMATLGPYENLVPQLHEMLKTLSFASQ